MAAPNSSGRSWQWRVELCSFPPHPNPGASSGAVPRPVFLFVVTIVVIVGSLMYVIEGEEHGFSSIPISIYWAVVTLTTVGYGHLAPAPPWAARSRWS